MEILMRSIILGIGIITEKITEQLFTGIQRQQTRGIFMHGKNLVNRRKNLL